MKAKVRGFRGAEKADIEINPIALLSGLNGAGKSSICQAVAAAACGQAIPFFNSSRPDKPRFTKADAKGLLRGGMEVGMCAIEIEGEPVASVSWPGMAVNGNGKLQCSLVAAGLVNPMEMDDVERQRFFSSLLKADPTIRDLSEKLTEDIPVLADPDNAAPLEKVLAMVETNGWDVAHRHFKENGARRKGEWEGRSGESFGLKKAVDWKPEGWRAELDDVSLEDLGSACTQAQGSVEGCVAALAIDSEELKNLSALASGESNAWNGMKKAETYLTQVREDLAEKEKIERGIVVPTSTPCPHCGGLVDVFGTARAVTLKQSMASASEIEAAAKSLSMASSRVKAAKTMKQEAQEAYNKAKAFYDTHVGASDRLNAAGKRKGTAEAVDVARDYLAGLLRDKDMVERRQACDVLSQQILANQKLVDILAPEGLRRQKLQKALTTFNKRLADLSSSADFSTVTIDDNLEILYGGRRYFLLSQSEQYRVRSVVQTLVALYDKSPLVILDGADVLDQAGRNGMFAMLHLVDTLRFIVGITVLARKNVPDLAKAGIGASYWVDAGTAAPL